MHIGLESIPRAILLPVIHILTTQLYMEQGYEMYS